MYDGLAGQVALVTGGAQGIGLAVCELLVAAGAAVVIADNDEEAGTASAQRLNAEGRCEYEHVDISDEVAVQTAVGRCQQSFGGLDLLVNNAGAFVMRGLDASCEDWRTMLDVNIMGYALCTKHAAKVMQARGRGAVVNISSISGLIAQPGLLTYATVKGAVSSLTRAAALELAPKIRVNAVSPGPVYTANHAELLRDLQGLDRVAADCHPDLGGRAMLRRLGDPHEIAKVVCFLASDDASYMTAANVVVDGGFSVR